VILKPLKKPGTKDPPKQTAITSPFQANIWQ